MNDLAFPLSATPAAPPAGAGAGPSGLSALTADDFMTLLIAQLQNQDPSEPVSNENLLDQLATMRALQADVELEAVLEGNAGAADLSTAAGFLGKEVRGFLNSEEVAGVAERAFLADGAAYLEVGGTRLPLAAVSEVA